MFRAISTFFLLRLVVIALAWSTANSARADLRLRDICHVKGQEENTLHGIGLVVGLKGSGDNNFKPTARALATMMKMMRNPLAQGPSGEEVLEELKEARNVALVMVTATVPGTGARQGTQLNCQVSAIGAKSLDGGILMMTPMLGPRPGTERVYAFAQGPIHLEDPTRLATGKIFQGCRLEADFNNVFVKDGKITLVLDRYHAGFETAQEVAELVNTQASFQSSSSNGLIAKALDQVNIEVTIPPYYVDDPVSFVAQIGNQRIFNPQNEARVVINQRAGSVVIGADVEVGPVVVTHKNIVIDTEADAAVGKQFVPIDPTKTATTKLRDLVDALSAVKVPTEDIIEIIKGLERNGKLYGKLILE